MHHHVDLERSLALTLLPADVADDERLLLHRPLPPLGLRGVGLGVRGAFPVRKETLVNFHSHHFGLIG